ELAGGGCSALLGAHTRDQRYSSSTYCHRVSSVSRALRAYASGRAHQLPRPCGDIETFKREGSIRAWTLARLAGCCSGTAVPIHARLEQPPSLREQQL